jgi:hypothetical protein
VIVSEYGHRQKQPVFSYHACAYVLGAKKDIVAALSN